MSLLSRLAQRLPGYEQLIDVLDPRQSRQRTARDLAVDYYRSCGRPLDVLDLGCGEGASANWFTSLDPDVRWSGVDIAHSPEVANRQVSDDRFRTFDGVHLPYPDGSFDLVYCHQVLEHVRHPHELMAEVARVLRVDASFIGSVAYLEPYHSYSIFNFTPFGAHFAINNAAMRVDLLHYSSGAGYKILRQFLGGREWYAKFSRISLIYGIISIFGFFTRAPRRDINLLKLQYSGSFCFLATKPSET